MNVLAVELGGSHAECALVSDRSVIRAERVSLAPGSTLRQTIESLEPSLNELLQLVPDKEECSGIGFSFPGQVNSHTRRVVSTNKKFEDAPDVDLGEWARNRFGLSLRLENDARTALLGEWYGGAAQGCNDFVMVTLGTGVGGAAMIGGRLLRGKHFQAGCLLGHFTINYRGRLCTCGNIGCIETEASTAALPSICAAHPLFAQSSLAALSSIGYADVFSRAAAGDRCAMDIRDNSVRVWAAATVSWIHAYDPELVVFGGGVMACGAQILPAIEEYVAKHAWTHWGHVQVRAAELGSRAALLGAVPLFRMEAA